jgi:hypothetical protein
LNETALGPITLWLFNIAMENGPFIDDFPIKTSIYEGFSMAMLNNQKVNPIMFLLWLANINNVGETIRNHHIFDGLYFIPSIYGDFADGLLLF